MKNGFHQISVSPDSKIYTTFVTPGGHHEFKKKREKNPWVFVIGRRVFQMAISKAVQH